MLEPSNQNSLSFEAEDSDLRVPLLADASQEAIVPVTGVGRPIFHLGKDGMDEGAEARRCGDDDRGWEVES